MKVNNMGKIIYNPTGGGEVDIAPVVKKHAHIRSFKDFLKYTKKMDYFFWGLAEDVDISDFFDEDYSSNVISMVFLFGYSDIVHAPLLDTHNVENAENMFISCRNLVSVPLYNFSQLKYASYMFANCSSLEVIPAFDFSNITSKYNISNIFSNCSSLTEIHATGFKVNFNISASTRFTRAALLEILNNLETVTDTKTLTMGSTNLLKLTEEDIAIATNKNWTLA